MIRKDDPVTAGDVYVDGSRIGEVGSAVIKDRKIMSSDGILVVIVNVEMKERKLLIRPNITTRGFVQINENEELLKKIENEATKIIQNDLNDKKATFAVMKSNIITNLSSYINNLTGRRPIILPIISDIKREKND